MSGELHPVHRAYADAITAGNSVEIDLGRTVLCDACNSDLTDDPRSGGVMFGSYAYGPCCIQERMASIRSYGEEHFIRARCPEGMPFADWIRQIREMTGSNSIRIISRGRP